MLLLQISRLLLYVRMKDNILVVVFLRIYHRTHNRISRYLSDFRRDKHIYMCNEHAILFFQQFNRDWQNIREIDKNEDTLNTIFLSNSL